MKGKNLVLFGLGATVALLLLSFNSAIGLHTIQQDRHSVSPLFSIRTDQKLVKNSAEINTNHIGDKSVQSSIVLPQLSEAKGRQLLKEIKNMLNSGSIRDFLADSQPQNSIKDGAVNQEIFHWLKENAESDGFNFLINSQITSWFGKGVKCIVILFLMLIHTLVWRVANLWEMIYELIYGRPSTSMPQPSICQC